MLESIIQDVWHAARLLRRQPGFTIAAALSLALGIGGTTAMFTVVNTVALRPLPYANAGRLVWITQLLKKSSTDEVTLTPHFLEWRRQNKTFTDLAGYNYQTRNLTGLDEPIEVDTARASASLLPLLGVEPALGRNFLKDEDYKGRDHVALLSDQLWRQRFGADSKILGRAIALDGSLFTVIGVLPRYFLFPGPDPVQLITPLGKDEAAELDYKDETIIHNVIGRLRSGATLERATAELSVIQSRLPVPPFRPVITVKMLPLREYLFGSVKMAGFVLLGAAAFLLLIACANVSNLLLARWMRRDRELAIRSALGASRGRLISQLLTESGVLAFLSCGAGVVLAVWAGQPILSLNPYHISGLRKLAFDDRVLGFAVALGVATTIIFGLLPALRSSKVQLAESIKVGEASVVGGRASLRVLGTIAAAQVATVLVLATGTTLMLQSFWKLRFANLGFRPDHLIAAAINLSGPAYRESMRRSVFVEELLERTGHLPGVELAAIASAGEIPPGNGHATNAFLIEGRDQPLGGPRPIAHFPVVSPAYFALMRIPLMRGRLLQDADGPAAARVVVVNQALVRRYFSGENAIGKRVRNGNDAWRTIVGVVGDVKTSGLVSAPEPAMYLPYGQAEALNEIGVIIRSALRAQIIAGEFRKAVAGLDAAQPVATVQSMDDRLSESVSGPRFTALLLFSFSGVALLLGMMGVYGVVACYARSQMREFAVRQALGAQRSDLIAHVLRRGLWIIMPGLITGLLGAISVGRLLAGMLYNVPANDPLTLAAVSTGLTTAALLACMIPAVRAACADPLPLLRHD